MRLTEAQKDCIREERKLLTLARIGERYGVTRERIRQVCSEQPNEAKRAQEIQQGLGSFTPKPILPPEPPPYVDYVTRFTRPLKHLEDLALQTAIRQDPRNSLQVAKAYGLSYESVKKIRTCLSAAAQPIHPPPVLTPEQRRYAGLRSADARWGGTTPEQRRAACAHLAPFRPPKKSRSGAQT